MSPEELTRMFTALKTSRDFSNPETWVDKLHDFVWTGEDS